MRDHDLSGVPVVNEGGRCVGIITEADLVLSEEGEDLHLPHYFELFGGVVFLERWSHFEERRARRCAVDGRGHDDRGPDHDRARRHGARRPRA